MQVYDLLFKIEGLKAITLDGMTDDVLNIALYPVAETQDRRSRLSRLKAGELSLTPDLAIRLTEELDARLARVTGRSGPFLSGDDWYKPLPDFFRQLEKSLGDRAAMARANAAIASELFSLADYRTRDHALVVERHLPAVDSTRFPHDAQPVDPFDLPPARIEAGGAMMVRLGRPVTPWDARAWLFYVRTSDQLIWHHDASTIVLWHPGGPFELPTNYVGGLPGFPTQASEIVGEVTAFLLLEPLNSPAVTDLLSAGTRHWDGRSAPSLESIIHLVTSSRRLFQDGNSRSFAKGELEYEPPMLLVRRYRLVNA